MQVGVTETVEDGYRVTDIPFENSGSPRFGLDDFPAVSLIKGLNLGENRISARPFLHVLHHYSLTLTFQLRGPLNQFAAVSTESPRRGKLTQFVADHILGHVDRDELVAVVYCKSVAHEFGRDRRPA
jgi:hypothetical protein